MNFKAKRKKNRWNFAIDDSQSSFSHHLCANKICQKNVNVISHFSFFSLSQLALQMRWLTLIWWKNWKYSASYLSPISFSFARSLKLSNIDSKLLGLVCKEKNKRRKEHTRENLIDPRGESRMFNFHITFNWFPINFHIFLMRLFFSLFPFARRLMFCALYSIPFYFIFFYVFFFHSMLLLLSCHLSFSLSLSTLYHPCLSSVKKNSTRMRIEITDLLACTSQLRKREISFKKYREINKWFCADFFKNHILLLEIKILFLQFCHLKKRK